MLRATDKRMTTRSIRLSVVNLLHSFQPQYDFPWGLNEMEQTGEGVRIATGKNKG